MHHLLQDIALSIVTAAVFGALAYRLKQPTILGYLLAGALIGPEVGLKYVTDPVSIETISELGLILLLFIIGLEMDLRELARAGKQLFVTAIGQFVLCVLFGLAAFSIVSSKLFGPGLPTLYLALLCALSSTAVVVKLLYDKFELDTRAGRMTLGVLVVQDLWAIMILAFQPNFSNPDLLLIGAALLKGVALLGFAFLVAKYVLKAVFVAISKSPEIVVLIAVGWCAGLSHLGGELGLSKEMGALIAGISVASFPYKVHITAKTLPIRDFFLTLFFVSLGMKIVAPEPTLIIRAIFLVAFVFLSRFLTVYPLLILTGGGQRTAFITSINLAQISEFSLVIASLGLEFGHIGEDFVATMIFAMAISSVVSSYAIKFSSHLFVFFERTLRRIRGRRKHDHDHRAVDSGKYPIVILGYHHAGREFVIHLRDRDPEMLSKVLVIDFNLESLKELAQLDVAAMFGDLGSFDTLAHSHLEHASVIVSTIPDMLLKGTNNFEIVRACRTLAPAAIVIAVADSAAQSQKLYAAGASEVIMPYSLFAESLAAYLRTSLDPSEEVTLPHAV